jgi:hypothetical protein
LFGFPHQNSIFNSLLFHTCPISTHHRIHTKWILPNLLLEHSERHIMSYYLCARQMCAKGWSAAGVKNICRLLPSPFPCVSKSLS